MQNADDEVLFSCAVCHGRLSAAVREVAPPADAETWTPLDSLVDPCPPRMAAGTFAVDPEPGRVAWGAPPKGFDVPGQAKGPRWTCC